MGELRKGVGDLRGPVDGQRAKVTLLRGESEKLVRMCKRRDDQMVNLKHEIVEMHVSYQEVVEVQLERCKRG